MIFLPRKIKRINLNNKLEKKQTYLHTVKFSCIWNMNLFTYFISLLYIIESLHNYLLRNVHDQVIYIVKFLIIMIKITWYCFLILIINYQISFYQFFSSFFLPFFILLSLIFLSGLSHILNKKFPSFQHRSPRRSVVKRVSWSCPASPFWTRTRTTSPSCSRPWVSTWKRRVSSNRTSRRTARWRTCAFSWTWPTIRRSSALSRRVSPWPRPNS